MGELFQPAHLLVLMLVIVMFPVILIAPIWAIVRKAGFSPWFSLFILVPWVNVVMLYVFAFSRWRVVPAVPTGWAPASGNSIQGD